MKRLFFATVIAILTWSSVSAEERIPDIETTIQSQIDAFLMDDFDKAFTFASPMIQGMFGTSERFGAMVRNGYPMVWRPSEVRFLDVEARGSALYQRVLLRDASGVPHVLEYQMIPGPEGWRINGVQLLRAPDVGA